MHPLSLTPTTPLPRHLVAVSLWMRREWKCMRMMMQSGPGQTSQPHEDEEDEDEDDDDDDDGL
ncbi:Armadillo-like helical-containing protein [Dioscorea alata]|uniref:Armadillo-like helical-containing protein n=1 Tax=Dioscorea alata TaxID=55571 RepID=A0ACB7U6D6_DIOAL|nr:Armadillo-like helical-containing protein [Dioscorea alata]